MTASPAKVASATTASRCAISKCVAAAEEYKHTEATLEAARLMVAKYVANSALSHITYSTSPAIRRDRIMRVEDVATVLPMVADVLGSIAAFPLRESADVHLMLKAWHLGDDVCLTSAMANMGQKLEHILKGGEEIVTAYLTSMAKAYIALEEGVVGGVSTRWATPGAVEEVASHIRAIAEGLANDDSAALEPRALQAFLDAARQVVTLLGD